MTVKSLKEYFNSIPPEHEEYSVVIAEVLEKDENGRFAVKHTPISATAHAVGRERYILLSKENADKFEDMISWKNK